MALCCPGVDFDLTTNRQKIHGTGAGRCDHPVLAEEDVSADRISGLAPPTQPRISTKYVFFFRLGLCNLFDRKTRFQGHLKQFPIVPSHSVLFFLFFSAFVFIFRVH